MKKTLFALFAFTSAAIAGNVPFEWDHEHELGDRYILKTQNLTFAPTDQKFQTVFLPAGVHTVTVTAINTEGMESEPSEPLVVKIPKKPGQPRKKK